MGLVLEPGMTTADLARRNARPHAWLFAITATLGLIPGTYGLVMSALTLVFFPPVMVAWNTGLVLLVGYWCYVLDRPMVRGPGHLWTATAVFNGLMALGWLTLGAEPVWRAFETGLMGDALVLLAMVCWLGFLTLVAAHARTMDAPLAAAALDEPTRAPR
jgi:hypothetical protein